MLTHLSLENFKSWARIDRMQLGPITGLFGANSTGKSSILQAFLLMKQTVESADRGATFELGDDRSLASLGSFGDILFDHDITLPLKMGIGWSRGRPLVLKDQSGQRALFRGHHIEFTTEVRQEAEQIEVVELSYGIDGNVFRMSKAGDAAKQYEVEAAARGFDFIRNRGRPWPVSRPVKCYGFPDDVYAKYQNAGFLAELQLALENLLANVYYLGSFREEPLRHYVWKGTEPSDMGRRGERAIDAILASRARGKYISPGPDKWKKTLEERVAHWLKELGLIDAFRVEPISADSNLYRVLVQASSMGPEVGLSDVGFGISQVLPVLVLCYYVPEGSTVLLEEPEIHLHPSAQFGLADVFIDVCQNRNVQVIVESHSEYFLRRLQRRIAERLPPEKARLYFCDVEAGRSKLMPLEMDPLGNIRNWPAGFFGDDFREIAETAKARAQRGTDE